MCVLKHTLCSPCISYFSCCHEKKYLTKATKGQRVYFGSWFKSSRWQEHQQQELEGTGHIAPAIRKGRVTNAWCSTLSVFFIQSGPNPGDYTTHIHSRSSLQFKLFWKQSSRPIRRCVSMVILNPVKLTLTINCHSDEHVFCEHVTLKEVRLSP